MKKVCLKIYGNNDWPFFPIFLRCESGFDRHVESKLCVCALVFMHQKLIIESFAQFVTLQPLLSIDCVCTL